MPTWAKVADPFELIVSAAIRVCAHPAGHLNLPFGQALTTTRKEDRHGMGRAHHLCPELKEVLDQLHRLDIGHRPKDGASEALARRAWFSAPRKRLEGLGDPRLEHSRRALQRELEPRLPLSRPLDGARNDGGLSEPDLGDRGAEDEALGFFETQKHSSDGETLIRGAPRGEPKHLPKIGLLAVVGRAVGSTDLTPVPLAVNLPGQLMRIPVIVITQIAPS